MSSRIATSQAHPIEVDFVESDQLGLPGRLGLTFAPGKKGPSYHSNHTWDRSLTDDVDRLVKDAGMQVIVSLMEDHEYGMLGMDGFFETLAEQNVETIHYPIRDVNVPRESDTHSFRDLISGIRERLAEGKTVIAHCRGGKGRTGLVAAAVLAAGGMSADEAIALVRRVRPGTVETARQEQYVRDFAGGLD